MTKFYNMDENDHELPYYWISSMDLISWMSSIFGHMHVNFIHVICFLIVITCFFHVVLLTYESILSSFNHVFQFHQCHQYYPCFQFHLCSFSCKIMERVEGHGTSQDAHVYTTLLPNNLIVTYLKLVVFLLVLSVA